MSNNQKPTSSTSQSRTAKCNKMAKLLRRSEISTKGMPAWLDQLVPSVERPIRGNNAIVIPVEHRDGMPAIVVKLLPQWDGQCWYHPQIFNAQGKESTSPAAELDGTLEGTTWYVLLEEVVLYDADDFDPNVTGTCSEMLERLRADGDDWTDPGSGPALGVGSCSKRWCISDRDSVSRLGAGAHQIEQAFAAASGEEFLASQDAQDARAAEYEERSHGGLAIEDSFNVEDDEERDLIECLGANWTDTLRQLLDLISIPDYSIADLLQMVGILYAGNDEQRVKQQLRLAIAWARRLEREISAPVRRWAKKS